MRGIVSVGDDLALPDDVTITIDQVIGLPAQLARLQLGGTQPTPPAGVAVLWLDTTGGNITLNLVTGD